MAGDADASGRAGAIEDATALSGAADTQESQATARAKAPSGSLAHPTPAKTIGEARSLRLGGTPNAKGFAVKLEFVKAKTAILDEAFEMAPPPVA